MTIKGSDFLFSNYTSSGNDICTASLKNVSRVPFEKVYPSSFLADRFDIKPEPENKASDKTYAPAPYRKWQHLFGFHSWMPIYADIETVRSDPTSVRPGVTILSQNNLSTLTTPVTFQG
jgi:hypothetical protein